VPIEVEKVERNNESEPYTTSFVGDKLEVKIGDPDVTLIGAQTYTIVYTASAAVNFFDDHTELYWNVTGSDWEVPLGAVEVSARLATQVAVDQLQVRCFTGIVGATTEDCTTTTSDSAAGAQANGQPLTIVFGWPNGVVTKPANYDEIRSTAGTTRIGRFFKQPIVFWGLNIVWPFLVGLWLIQHWRKRGRDVPGKGTVIAQYEPPAGLTPGEMGTLYDEHANHRDVIATIVDLAVRGYLEITEIETKKLLRTSKDYELTCTKDFQKNSTLREHERIVLAGLFLSEKVVSLKGMVAKLDAGEWSKTEPLLQKKVKLSDLKGSFANDLKDIRDKLYAQVRDQGYFTANPNTVRIVYIVAGLAMAGLGFLLVEFFIVGPITAGLLVAAVGPFMPKRTAKGAEALWHAKGFKLFLEKAEKYRIKWQEKENIFETYLPYAMAFGVADKWTKAFEGLQKEAPNWYHGNSSTFNTVMFWSAMNSFSTASAKSFAPPAASGGSGLGGGGFSGGGFGGGGGGSW
jgi:uncharacterized membrane protein